VSSEALYPAEAAADKRDLRRQFCDLRECLLPVDLSAASEAVCARLARFDPLLKSLTAMMYVAFRNEIDLGPLPDSLPRIRWGVPRVVGERMAVHVYDPEQLVRHRFGMLEPSPRLPVIEPAEIDIVLVPGVAFDRRGGRLGFGGGFYDRFLPLTSALRVGISHAPCLADELPCDTFDARMDWVITPDQEVYCAPLWRVSTSVPPTSPT
jgi:5-formyltetrahydrofolate cyclo-ligase